MVMASAILLSSALVAQPCKPTVNLGSSISFCSGNSIQLNAFNANSTYLWSTGATSPSITATQSGTYWVRVTNSCGSTTDSINITASNPLFFSLGANRKVCVGNPVTLTVPFQQGTTYSWSTGSSSNTINVNRSGTYYVAATNACGTYRDTVQLTFEAPANINLGGSILECVDSTVTLRSGASTGIRQWSNGSTADSIVVSSPGNYWLRITNSCGSFYDTVSVNFLTNYELIIPDTVELCKGGNVNLITTVTGSYLWSNGSSNQTTSVSAAGTYTLQVTNNCGTLSDTVVVVEVPEPSVNLGADTTICAGNAVVLNANNLQWPVLWSTGSTAQTISVSQTGTYWVRVNNGCKYFYDTINVSVTPIPAINLNDTVRYCPGSPVTLDAGSFGPGTSYQWSNGGNSQTQTFGSPGQQSVIVSNACATDTFVFHLIPDSVRNVSLGPDTVFSCDAQYVVNLSGVNAGDSIVWSNGATQTSTININNSGVYSVQVFNNCGSYTDTVNVMLIRKPNGIAKDTFLLCSNTSSVRITAPMRSNTHYLWSTGDTLNYINATSAGAYSVIMRNLCDTVYDSVYVKAVNPLSISAGPDQSFCQGGSVIISASGLSGAHSFSWNDGNTDTVRTISTPGTYIATATNGCGSVSDTVVITRLGLPFSPLKDTAVCAGSSMILNASHPRNNGYLWNTGDTTASIQITNPGTYWVSIGNQCDTITDTVHVLQNQPLGTVNLGNDTIFCAGTLMLDAGFHPDAFYYWQNGSSSQYFNVTTSGTYFVRVQNSCGVKHDTINVLITGPPRLVLGNSVQYCSNNVLTLNAQNPGSTYLWSTGDTSQTITVNAPGPYWVQVTNNCGSISDTVIAQMESPPVDLDLGNDTTICSGDTLTLNTGYPNISSLWQDGSRDHRLLVTTAGLYHVKLTNSCGNFFDSIYVKVRNQSPGFDLGDDTSYCAIGGSITIGTDSSATAYAWNTGDTTAKISVSQPGIYSLTTTDFCGYQFTDSLYVDAHYPVALDLGEDTMMCPNSTLVIESGVSAHSVVWHDGFIGPDRYIIEAGIYSATVKNSCGVFTDTIVVYFKDEPHLPYKRLPLCEDDSVFVDASKFIKDSRFDFDDYDIYWDDGSREMQRYFTGDGSARLIFEDYCNRYTQTFDFDTELCICPVFIAKAFSPNNDGLNDSFTIGGACEFTNFHLKIYNRWGDKVFESFDPDKEWDGTNHGSPVPTGTYSYFVTYGWSELEMDHAKERRGTVTIIR